MDATTLAERGAGEDLVRMRALQRADREPPEALDAAALRNATERERRWEDIRRAHLQLIRPSWLGTGLCGCCKNGGSIARRLLRPPSLCERYSRRDLAEHPVAARLEAALRPARILFAADSPQGRFVPNRRCGHPSRPHRGADRGVGPQERKLVGGLRGARWADARPCGGRLARLVR